MIVYIDVETASPVDLKIRGVAPYAAHPDTRITVASLAVDDGAVQSFTDLDELERRLLRLMYEDTRPTMIAHNAEFDRSVLVAKGRKTTASLAADDSLWVCSMKLARWLNLPGALDNLAAYLLGERKDAAGRAALMQQINSRGQMAIECNRELIQTYCEKDVDLTRRCYAAMREMLGDEEWRRFFLEAKADAHINRAGLPLDSYLIDVACERVERLKDIADKRITRWTGGAVKKASSRKAIADRIERMLPPVTRPKRNGVEDLLGYLKASGLDDEARSVAQAIRIGGQASLAKWANVRQRNHNGRLYGAYAFCAAVHGRWTAFGTQLHNFPRSKARSLTAKLADGATGADLSIGLRSMVAAPEGKLLTVADYSQIEFRVLCWAAGETDMLNTLRGGTDPYVAMARKIWPRAEITKELRSTAKSAVLGLGYGMGVDKFAAYAGVSASDAQSLYNAYHNALPGVKRLYKRLEGAYKSWGVPSFNAGIGVDRKEHLEGRLRRRAIRIQLPSGRIIRLWDAGKDQAWAGGRPYQIWGAVLTEYVVCGIARDLMANALFRALLARLRVIGHVHDEILIEHPAGDTDSRKKLVDVMLKPGDAYAGLPLDVESMTVPNWGAAK